MSEINGIAKEIVKTIREDKNKGTKPYDTQATVMRVEDGTAWVRIPGGVDETPAQLTMDAKEGDNVQVRVSGGRAWLAGNGTSPPTDDAKAVEANETAKSASIAARAAFNAADAAQTDAARAHDAADKAETSASEAKTQATAATSYANGALNSLSTTQDIIGVLSWVEESIKYVWDYPPTVEDKEYDPSKQYYTVIGKRVIGPIETDYDKYYVLDSESEPASKTGNIVTFDSDLDNFPLKSVTATIDPKQDLHGYDKPWVGGAGKNKLPNATASQTINGVTFTANANGTVKINGTATASADFYFVGSAGVYANAGIPTGDYILTGSPSGAGTCSLFVVRDDGTILAQQHDNTPQTISIDSSRTYRIFARTASGLSPSNVILSPMIRLASVSDATYEPYENICPISGWDSVEAVRAGKNLLDSSYGFTSMTLNGVTFTVNEDKSVTINGTATANTYFNYTFTAAVNTSKPMPQLAGKTVTIRCLNANGNMAFIPNFFREDGTHGGMGSYSNSEATTRTIPSDFYSFRAYIYVQSGKTVSNLTVYPQIEHGTAATAYEPYQADTYTTDLPETVYGGSLDVVNGVLTVDRAMVDLGTLNWTYSNSFFRTGGIASAVKRPPNNQTKVIAISSAYPIMTWAAISGTDTAIAVGTTGEMILANPNITSLSDFQTAMNGVQLVYELAEPRTIRLTPTQINTLLGENNVWADAGDATVEYWDGPVGYVTPTSSFDPAEPYYAVKGSPVKIDESKQEEHGKGLYYVHDLTNAKEAMADFIKARLALTDKGLYVVGGDTENEGYKILLASDGMTVYDAQGVAVSKFGENIEFSSTRAQYIGNEDAFIVFNPTTAEITIGGDVLIDGTKRLSDVLTDLDVSVTQTATGADITVNGDTVSIANGQAGEDGSTIWTTTTAPTTPNYTFTISHLSGAAGLTPKIGDVIIYSYYHYQITSVTDTTVRSTTRVSIRGATGTAGKWYTGTGITGTSTTETIYSDSGVASAVVGDMYLNTDTNNTYRCTKAGAPTVAKWVFADNIQGEQGPQGIQGVQGPQGDTGPEAIVTVSVTAINYIAKTATLSATLRVDGVVTTPTSYKWTKGTSTTSLGTGATLNVTDLNAVYNCTATW